MPTEEEFAVQRERMVRDQLIDRNIADPRVLDAMRRVPRHQFVPKEYQFAAYRDRPLSIGYEQTISQPYIVAFMLETLQMSGHEIVLEVGTGSGYQTALLAELGACVYSVERHRMLARQSGQRLDELGYENIEIYVGDGSQGLADMAPFDCIIVSASAPSLPKPLMGQLREAGRLIMPIGDRRSQYLERVWRVDNEFQFERLLQVMFVPLIGRYGFKEI
ncbi:MAG: protein-L-isoaspartate(D-aspartate) O-methyltransferase [Chloroflexi bacterium]|nr:protein-L-isoaspartate(D-aspartate) O-methyltransferase [Chloroflexota bacterium]